MKSLIDHLSRLVERKNYKIAKLEADNRELRRKLKELEKTKGPKPTFSIVDAVRSNRHRRLARNEKGLTNGQMPTFEESCPKPRWDGRHDAYLAGPDGKICCRTCGAEETITRKVPGVPRVEKQSG